MAERTDELAERMKRGLRAARDRRRGDERDHDFLRELSVDGLQALDALLAELAKERAAAAYWRGLLADTAAGLRAQNLSPRMAAGAIERAMDAARSLESIAASGGGSDA